MPAAEPRHLHHVHRIAAKAVIRLENERPQELFLVFPARCNRVSHAYALHFLSALEPAVGFIGASARRSLGAWEHVLSPGFRQDRSSHVREELGMVDWPKL